MKEEDRIEESRKGVNMDKRPEKCSIVDSVDGVRGPRGRGCGQF